MPTPAFPMRGVSLGPTTVRWLALFLLAGAAGALLAFGILGVGRSEAAGNFDMRYLYYAGEAWERGLNPYAHTELDRMASVIGFDPGAFAYPPVIAPLCMLLSLGSLSLAHVVMTALNVACVFLIAWLFASHQQTRTFGSSTERTLLPALAAAVIIGNPFTAHVVWMGQTSLLAATCALGAWRLTYSGERQYEAGILLGLSAIKPQLTALVWLWFALDGRARVLGTGALTALILSLPAVLAVGPVEAWSNWLQAIAAYQQETVTGIGFRHVFGLRSVLHALGAAAPTLAPLAFLSVFLLHKYRARVDVDLIPGALFAISALFVYAHDYDLSATTVLTASLLWCARRDMRMALTLMAFLYFFPQRIWERFDLGHLVRTRELALVGFLCLALYERVRTLRPVAAESAPPAPPL